MFHGLVGSRSGQPPRLLVESSSTMNHPLPEAAQEAELSSPSSPVLKRSLDYYLAVHHTQAGA
jgi:hypothetical protein